MTKKLIDHHEVDIYDYEDGSMDLSIKRDGLELDEETAYQRLATAARSMSEDLAESREVFSIRVYENGHTTTAWRNDEDFATEWARFEWVKSRAQIALYSPMIYLPQPPEWLMKTLWMLEYAVSWLILRWWFLRGKVDRVPSCPSPDANEEEEKQKLSGEIFEKETHETVSNVVPLFKDRR